MRALPLVLLILLAWTSIAVAETLTEGWPDPLAGWRDRWVALNTNMQNWYVCNGDPDENNRGNNPCGLWICDGDGARHHDDSIINFDPVFGATINYFEIGIASYISDAALRVYDMSNTEILNVAVSPTFDVCNTNFYSVASGNGVSRFEIVGTQGGRVEGNVGIDDMRVDTIGPISVESASWGRIKAGYR